MPNLAYITNLRHNLDGFQYSIPLVDRYLLQKQDNQINEDELKALCIVATYWGNCTTVQSRGQLSSIWYVLARQGDPGPLGGGGEGGIITDSDKEVHGPFTVGIEGCEICILKK